MKNYIKKHWVISLLLFVALAASAAKIGDDLLRIGKPGSTGDKSIVFDVGDGASNPSIVVDNTDKDFDFNKAMNIAGDLLKVGDGTNSQKDIIFDIGAGASNPSFRWDSVNNFLTFANDGSSFTPIGSGSGGASGVNLIDNFDFEIGTPPSDWTASGGTFVAETSAPLFGGQSGSWDSNALDQTLDSGLYAITSGFLGQSCQAEITYKYASGAAGDYILVARQFDDSGATEIDVATIDLEVTGTETRKAQLFFDCPDDVADTLRLRIQSKVADAGIVILDDAFNGTGRNTFSAKPQDVFSARASNTGVVTNENLNFIDGDCSFGATGVGTCNFIANKFTSAPNCQLTTNQAGFDRCVHLTGVTSSGFTYSTFTCSTNAAANYGMDMSCQKVESSANKEAITLETSGWYVDGNIGGALVNLGTTTAVYDEMTNAGLDLVLNTGSASAQIPCVSGNASSGLTCSSGDESVGIVFDAPSAGLYEACFSFSHRLGENNAGATGDYDVTFEVVETSNLSDTVLARGNGRANTAMDTDGSNASTATANFPVNVCGVFNFSSAGQKTLRVLREQDFSGTSPVNLLTIDRNAVRGDRDLRVLVKKLNEQFPTPIFTDLQNSLNDKVSGGESGVKLVGARINNGGSATINTEYGSWIDTVTRSSAGTVDIDILSGVASTVPVCTCVGYGVGNRNCLVVSSTNLTVRVLTETADNAADTDTDFHINCMFK